LCTRFYSYKSPDFCHFSAVLGDKNQTTITSGRFVIAASHRSNLPIGSELAEKLVFSGPLIGRNE